MFDDFFARAMIAGIGVALIAAPLGCFIVWRRMAYFGDTISHSALLGVALGFLLQINIALAVFAVANDGFYFLVISAIELKTFQRLASWYSLPFGACVWIGCDCLYAGASL